MRKQDIQRKMQKQSSKLTNKLNKLLENTGDMALKRRARRIIEEINPQDGDKILEVGCGDGFYLHLLSNLGIKLNLTGADFDKRALESARKNLGRKKIKLYLADLMKGLPFKDKTFDKIVMSEVVEHLPDDVKGLNEVKRVLKKGGTLVLTVPNHNYPFFWDPVNWILEHFFGTHIKSGFWAGIWNQHLRLYSPEEAKKVVQKAGFSIKIVESVTHYSLPFNHNILNLAARMLYGGRMNPQLVQDISKFSTGKKRKISFVTVVFDFVDKIDKLNNGVTDKSSVSVFIKATK